MRRSGSKSRKSRSHTSKGSLHPKRSPGSLLALLLGVVLTSAGFLIFEHFEDRATAKAKTAANSKRSELISYYELLALPPAELAKIDLALMNLLCAKGLPGAENLDIPKSLATINTWAQNVRSETERHLYRVTDPRFADHYKHSEARLRAEFIVQILQEDCGVHYNLERIRDIDFSNSRDLFLNGMIGSDNGGTCASMPVLYTVIGRRLGYPIKLVGTKEHLFCRWDSDKERFNIEGASNGGVDYYPDEFYQTWPHRLTELEIKSGEYLRSFTPRQELSIFLQARGNCLRHNGRMPEALAAFSEAHRLMPIATNPIRSLQAVFRPRRFQQNRSFRDETAWLPESVRQNIPPDPNPQIPQP